MVSKAQQGQKDGQVEMAATGHLEQTERPDGMGPLALLVPLEDRVVTAETARPGFLVSMAHLDRLALLAR